MHFFPQRAGYTCIHMLTLTLSFAIYNLSVTRADRVLGFILERTFVQKLPPSEKARSDSSILNPGDSEEDIVYKIRSCVDSSTIFCSLSFSVGCCLCYSACEGVDDEGKGGIGVSHG